MSHSPCLHFALVFLVALQFLASGWLIAPLHAQAAPADTAATEDLDLTDDPLFQQPQTLSPNRSEEEEDKLAASSWFLRGRLAYQRDDHPQALRYYQRAWQFDPSAVSILREIVPLAFELKHNAVAARYAVIMAETSPRDSTLLRRLAQHLMDERDFGRALKLYEKSLDLRDEDAKTDARYVLSQMEIARLYFIEDEFDRAATAFDIVRDALENPERYELSDKIHTTLLGNPRVTYTLIAESFLEAGRLEQAAQMFEKAMPDKASAPLLAYHLARIEMANGRPRSALRQLDEYLVSKQSGAGRAAYELLEEVFSEVHEKDAADKLRERLQELQRDDPANAPLAYFLADKLHEAKKLDEAAVLLEATLETEPSISAYAALIEIYHEQQSADKLLDALGGTVQRLGSFRAIEEQAGPVAEDKKLVKEILRIAEERQKKEAKDESRAHQAFAAGLLAIDAEMFDQAEEQMEIAAEDKERLPAVLESWGLQMFISGEYARAAKVFRRAIDDDVAQRFNGDFYYYLAAALEFDGQTEAALEAANKAAEEKPESPRYASRYAWVLYHAKRYAEADEEYRKLLEKFDDDHSEEDIRDVVRESRMVLSNVAIHLDRMPQAEQWLLEVLDEYPEDIGAHNDLGYLWSDQGKHLKRSLRMVEAAVAAEPDNAAYRDSLGWAHFQLGQIEEAITQLERAAEDLADTPDGVIMDHLGDAYLAAGRKADAAKAYQKAIELFQDDEDSEHVKKTQKKLDALRDEGRGTRDE